MRIVVVHNRYRSASPSGENQVVDRETTLLRRAGHEVIGHERASDEIPFLSLVDRALVPPRIIWSGPERRRLSSLLETVRPDVVHLHNLFPLLSPSVLAACRQHGVPVVLTLHNYRLVCANGLLTSDAAPCHRCVGRPPVPAVLKGCYRNSPVRTLPVAAMIATHQTLGTWRRLVDRFVVPSEFARGVMVAGGLPPERLTVKPHFVDDPGSPPHRAGEGVLYLGRLSPEKGLDLLMRAWERKTAPGRLVIVGDGLQGDQVRLWADGRPDVTCLGRLEPLRCRELLRRARCLVVPSTFEETFGLVIIEAFANGIPVIGCALGAVSELVEDGRSGWVVPAGDASALADRIDRALVDPELTQRMGSYARRRYEQRYSPAVNLAILERLYGDVAGRSRP